MRYRAGSEWECAGAAGEGLLGPRLRPYNADTASPDWAGVLRKEGESMSRVHALPPVWPLVPDGRSCRDPRRARRSPSFRGAIRGTGT